MADNDEPSENPECLGVETGEIFEGEALENVGVEGDLSGEGTFSIEDNVGMEGDLPGEGTCSIEDNADDEELVGDGADDDDDDQDGDEINCIGWVEDLWNKKKAEEATVSKDDKKEGEEASADDDYEMKDQSEEMLDSSLKEQTLSEEEKPSGDLKSSSESETTTGAEEKKALPGFKNWKEGPESGNPQALAKSSLCIPNAFFGPSFDKSYFQCCIRASPVVYSCLILSRLQRVLKSADTVVAKCGPKGSSRELEIYCQAAPLLLRQLMVTPLGGDVIHFRLEKRKATAWTKITHRGKMMSAPVSLSDTLHTAKFSLRQAYFRKHLGKSGMSNNHEGVKDRSLFLSNLPTTSDIGHTLKTVFPLALNIDVVKVSENQRSAVLKMTSHQAVVDHLISIQNLHICGRKVELGSTSMTQQDAMNKFLTDKSPKKQTSSPTDKSGEADSSDKTGAKQGKKTTSEEQEEKKRGREQRERNQKKERGPKPQRDRSRLRAGDNRTQMRRRDQGPPGLRGARTGFQKPRRPERWAGRGQMSGGPMRQPGLLPNPGMEMEMLMQHEMQMEREFALQREMEVQRDMERHRETLIQREMGLQRKRQQEEEERYGRRDWPGRDRWEEWEGANNRQRGEGNRQRGGEGNRQRGGAANRQRGGEVSRQRQEGNRQREEANRQRQEACAREEQEVQQRKELIREKERLEHMHQDALHKLKMVEEQQQRDRQELQRQEQRHQRDREELQRKQRSMETEKKRMQQQLEAERRRQQQQQQQQQQREKEEWKRKARKQDRFPTAQRGRRNQQQHASPGRGGRSGEESRDMFYGDDRRQDGPGQRSKGFSPGGSSEASTKHKLELEVARQAEELQKSLDLLEKIKTDPAQVSASLNKMRRMATVDRPNEFSPSTSFNRQQKPASGYGTQQPASGYGTQQPASGYGTQQPASGYGTQQPASGYGTQQPASGYGTQQPASGYGTQQPASGYGTQQPASGYGTQQPEPYGRDVDMAPPYSSNQDYSNRGQYYDYGHEKSHFQDPQRDDQTHEAAGGYSSGNWTQNSAAGHQSSVVWGAGAANTDSWQRSGGYSQSQTYSQTDDFNIGGQQTADSYGQDGRHEGYGGCMYDQVGNRGREGYDQREGHRGGQARGGGSSSGQRNDRWFRNSRDYHR